MLYYTVAKSGLRINSSSLVKHKTIELIYVHVQYMSFVYLCIKARRKHVNSRVFDCAKAKWFLAAIEFS